VLYIKDVCSVFSENSGRRCHTDILQLFIKLKRCTCKNLYKYHILGLEDPGRTMEKGKVGTWRIQRSTCSSVSRSQKYSNVPVFLVPRPWYSDADWFLSSNWSKFHLSPYGGGCWDRCLTKRQVIASWPIHPSPYGGGWWDQCLAKRQLIDGILHGEMKLVKTMESHSSNKKDADQTKDTQSSKMKTAIDKDSSFLPSNALNCSRHDL